MGLINYFYSLPSFSITYDVQLKKGRLNLLHSGDAQFNANQPRTILSLYIKYLFDNHSTYVYRVIQ